MAPDEEVGALTAALLRHAALPEGLPGRDGALTEEALDALAEHVGVLLREQGYATVEMGIVVLRLLDVRGAAFPPALDPLLPTALVGITNADGYEAREALLELLRERLEALPAERGAEALRQLGVFALDVAWQTRRAPSSSGLRGLAQRAGLEVLEGRARRSRQGSARLHSWASFTLVAALRRSGWPEDLPAAWDALFIEDVSRYDADTDAPWVEELREVLKALPPARREAVLLASPVRWALLDLCPTDAVLERIGAEVEEAYRITDEEWTGQWTAMVPRPRDRTRQLIEATAARLGSMIVPWLLGPLERLEGPGQWALAALVARVVDHAGTERLLAPMLACTHPAARGVLLRRIGQAPAEVTAEALRSCWDNRTNIQHIWLARVLAIQAIRADVGALIEALWAGLDEDAAEAREGLEIARRNLGASPGAFVDKGHAWLAEEPRLSADDPWVEARRLCVTVIPRGWRASLEAEGLDGLAWEPWAATAALALQVWRSGEVRAAERAQVVEIFGLDALAHDGHALLRARPWSRGAASLYVWLVEQGRGALDLHLKALGCGFVGAAEVAVRALAPFGEEAADLVAAQLKDRRAPQRTAAARALASMRARPALPALRAALDRERVAGVRQALQQAVEAVTASEAPTVAAQGLWTGPDDYDLQQALERLRAAIHGEATGASWLRLCDVLQRMEEHGHGALGVEYVLAGELERWLPATRLRPIFWEDGTIFSPLLPHTQAPEEPLGLIAQLHRPSLRDRFERMLLELQGRYPPFPLHLSHLELLAEAAYFGWEWCAARELPPTCLEIRVDGAEAQRRGGSDLIWRAELLGGVGFQLVRGAVSTTAPPPGTPAGLRMLRAHIPSGHPAAIHLPHRARFIDLRGEFGSIN